MDDAKLPESFRIGQLCHLPHNLARTGLVVRPCVALLHASPDAGAPSADESLMPQLNAREVAAVFSAPLHNFLRSTDEVAAPGAKDRLPEGDWYEGSWTQWHEAPWRVHYFYVPVRGQQVAKPKATRGGQAAIAEHPEEEGGGEPVGRYKVWGMTARMLVDAATVAYGEQPEFEHNSHFGDEAIIEGLAKTGRLGETKLGSELAQEDPKEASKM